MPRIARGEVSDPEMKAIAELSGAGQTMSEARTSRRDVLAGAALALAGTVLPARGGLAAPGVAAAGTGGATVVLQDHRFALPREVQQRLAGSGAQLVALEADPVRQWRGADAQLLGARGTRLFGVTRWPEFLLVRGLAEESGRRVRHQQFDAASSTMVWLIA